MRAGVRLDSLNNVFFKNRQTLARVLTAIVAVWRAPDPSLYMYYVYLKKRNRSFATDQIDPLGENYICDHCDPLLRKWITPLLILPSDPYYMN